MTVIGPAYNIDAALMMVHLKENWQNIYKCENVLKCKLSTCVRSLGTDLSLAALASTIGLMDQMQIRPQLSLPETISNDSNI